MKKIAAVLSSVVAVSVFGQFVDTGSAIVRQHPQTSLLWKTVTSSRMDVMLDWPKGAVSAAVAVDGEVRASVADPLAASAEVSFNLPASEAEERTVTLTAAYFDGEGNVLKESEVELALVCKADSGAVRHRPAGSREWGKAYAKSAVLPIPENAAELTVGGESVADMPSAPGWYWWRRVPSSPTALALTLDDGSVCENSVCGPAGLTIILK
jgi:hypothetical protein